MIALQDVWSAVDHAYEAIAELQFQIADRSRISGDVDIFNKKTDAIYNVASVSRGIR